MQNDEVSVSVAGGQFDGSPVRSCMIPDVRAPMFIDTIGVRMARRTEEGTYKKIFNDSP